MLLAQDFLHSGVHLSARRHRALRSGFVGDQKGHRFGSSYNLHLDRRGHDLLGLARRLLGWHLERRGRDLLGRARRLLGWHDIWQLGRSLVRCLVLVSRLEWGFILLGGISRLYRVDFVRLICKYKCRRVFPYPLIKFRTNSHPLFLNFFTLTSTKCECGQLFVITRLWVGLGDVEVVAEGFNVWISWFSEV